MDKKWLLVVIVALSFMFGFVYFTGFTLIKDRNYQPNQFNQRQVNPGLPQPNIDTPGPAAPSWIPSLNPENDWRNNFENEREK